MNMRPLWRSLLLVFVLWFALFPASSYASETVTNSVYDYSIMTLDDYGVMPLADIDEGDLLLQVKAGLYDYSTDSYSWSNKVQINDLSSSFSLWPVSGFDYLTDTLCTAGSFTLYNSTSSLAPAGSSLRILCDNFRLALYVDSVKDSNFVSLKTTAVPFDSYVNITYSGTVKNVGGNTYTSATHTEKVPFSAVFNTEGRNAWNNGADLTLSLPFPSDNYIYTDSYGNVFEYEWQNANVSCIEFVTAYKINTSNYPNMQYVYLDGMKVASQFGWDNCNVYVIQSDSGADNESNAISSGISAVNNTINTMSNTITTQIAEVKTSITSLGSSISAGFTNMGNAISNGVTNIVNNAKENAQAVVNKVGEVKDAVLNLPETIGNKILELFVPSETAIAEMKDKWDTLLSDRFGVVYESGALVIDIANSVSDASTSETITFPSVSYNFSGTEFTFGGYEVDVIPNGFEFLADILKGVLDIVCTLAFINAMRRKYDELMMR